MNNKIMELAKNWEVTKLSSLLLNPKNDLVDGPFGSNMKSSDFVYSGVPVFKIQNIKANRFIDKNISFVTPEKANELKRHSFKSGDLIITKLGNPLGLCCEVPIKYEEGIIVADLMRLRVSSRFFDKKFLIYLVNSSVIQEQFKKITKGTTRQRVNLTIVRELDFPIPPTNEQHRIVAKIEALFSELDKGVESLKTAREQLKIYRQALLKHAFSGKLTEQWRAENPDKLETAEALLQRIQTEREQRYQQQLNDWEATGKQGTKPKAPKTLPPLTADELAELPELPEGWAWVKVGEISDVQLGRQRSPNNRSNNYPTKYIRAGNLTENGLNLDDVLDMEFEPQDKERFLLAYGDVLLSEASGSANQVGKPAIWHNEIEQCCFQNTVIRIRSISLSEYLFWVFKTYYLTGVFSKLSGGVGINHLSAGKLESMATPIVGKLESEKILELINEKLSLMENLDQTLSTALQQAETLRQSILKKAFSGQLVAQDPNDEPASELLKRIQAEKSAVLATVKPKAIKKARV
jgi:type I restriction enzyme, S subunit